MVNKRPSSNRSRRSGSRGVTTRSGRVLRVNRSLGQKWLARKEAKSRRKAQRLAGLPKSRLKRAIWKLHPRRLAAYWFSRDGAIMALKIAGIGILAFFLLTLAVFSFFRKELPDITDISGRNLGGSISYYDRTGKHLLWQDYNAVKRVPIPGSEMSQFIKDATVAIEDRDFYNHRGFDLRGITRAAFKDIAQGSTKQGGSTITQQLVKLSLDWTQERTFARKAKELILAVELERTYTKAEILTGYLNSAPYGSVDYGVQAASSDYFHKDAKDLALDEAAFLAAIPQSPSVYSPWNTEYFNEEALIGRKNYVLDVMVDTGKITRKQAEDAKKVDVLAKVKPQQTKYAGIKAPYFVLAAKNQLTDPESGILPNTGKSSGKIGGWKVITTLDMKLQDLAEEQVSNGLAQVRRQGGDNVAFAAEDVETGQMVALVGGVDFNNKEYGQLNYAQTPLPPGSSFKPYDYTALIENSTTAGAGSVLYDTRGPLPGYPCTNKARRGGNCLNNFDFRTPGPLTIRYALGGSRNIPAVKAFLIAGVDKTVETAEKLGLKNGYKCYLDQALTQETQCYGAAGIGDGAYLRLDEHVHGYASLSRLGKNIKQTYILKIENDIDKTIYDWNRNRPKPEEAVRADTAYIISDILSDPNASYFSGNKPHRYGNWRFAMKTGTTNDAKDGWLMGYSTKYAAGVWVGHHTRQVEMRGFMENMTRPIWNGWMRAAHDGVQAVNWTQPSGVKRMPAFVVRNHVGLGSVEPSPATELYPSWYRPKTNTSKTTTIDKVSNKVATDCTPKLARQTVGGSSNASQFSIDTFYGNAAGSTNTTANDDVHSCSDSRPSVDSVFAGEFDITGGDSATCGSTCEITVTVSAGTHPLNSDRFSGTVNLLVNGAAVQSKKVSSSPSTVTFNYSGSGTRSISAQVIDSVLYDSSSSAATVTFESDSPPGEDDPPGGGLGSNCKNPKKCRGASVGWMSPNYLSYWYRNY